MRERPIAFYAEIARELKSINAAIFYQQIRYWSDKGSRDDGWIYKTAEDIEKETTLTEKQQRLCREKLLTMQWIDMKKIMHNGSMVWHYKILVDFSLQLKSVNNNEVPTGERPVGKGGATGPKASSTTGPKASSSIHRIHTETTKPEEKKFFPHSPTENESVEETSLSDLEEGFSGNVFNPADSEDVVEEEITYEPCDDEGREFVRAPKASRDSKMPLYKSLIAKYKVNYQLLKKEPLRGNINAIAVGKLVKHIRFSFKMTDQEIENMLEVYLKSQKAEDCQYSMTAGLSDDTCRLYLAGKLESGRFEKKAGKNVDLSNL